MKKSPRSFSDSQSFAVPAVFRQARRKTRNGERGDRGGYRSFDSHRVARGRNTRQFIGLYVRLSVSLGRVFVSVCIAVPSAKRRVQERAEVHEHVLHGDVHRRVHTEDRRIRRQGKLHYTNKSHLPSSNRLSKERTRLE